MTDERYDEIEAVLAAVRAALYTFPGQRVGQIITNGIGGMDPFYEEDKEMIRKLNQYVSIHGRASA